MPDSFGGIEVEDEWGGIALEEESTPEERPPRGEIPPMPVFAGKPEVLIEGSTRAVIPASLDVPEAPVPSRVVAPFDIAEFSRTGTPENPYGVATPGERAFTAAQPSEFDRPVIPPGVFKTALDIGTMTMPRTELMEGLKEGTAEQLAGMTSQTSAAMLPAFMLPYVGPALAMGMGAKAVGEGAGATVAALEAGDARGVGQGASQVAGGALMVAGGGAGARVAVRPAIPPRIIEAIAKADAVGLTKSAQAVADVVKREQPTQEVPSAVREPIPAEGVLRQERPEVELQGVRQPQAEAAIPREPARAQGGKEGQILLKREGTKAGVQDTELAADIARYNEIQAELKKASETNPMAFFEGPLPKEKEAIKNKYGGFEPVEPAGRQTILTDLEKATAVQAEHAIGPKIARLPEVERAATLAEMDKRYAELTAQEKSMIEKAQTDADLMEASRLGTQANVIKSAADVARGKAKPGVFNEQTIAQQKAATGQPVAGGVQQQVRATSQDSAGTRAEVPGGVRTTEPVLEPTPTAPITPEAVPARPVGDQPAGRGTVGGTKPSVFREASAQDVDSYVNPATDASTPFGIPEIHVATSRDLALGQGKNKSGIVVEFDPSQLDIAPPKQRKPGAEFVEQQGGGAEQIIRAQPAALRDKVKSITVPKSLGRSAKDPSGIRLRRFLDQNWISEASGETITYRPKAAEAAAPSSTFAAQAKVIADRLREQFKTETGGKTFTGPVEIINAAVEIAAKTIEYGGSAADAMAAALKHIRTNWKGEFDETAFRTRFDEAIKVPDTAGETVKMRKSAERAVESPQIPKPVQERIETAPESRYTQQSMARVEDVVKTMSDAELGSMPADSNLYVASKLEQADRRFRAGDNDGGYQIFVELEKQGTSFGQNINQFKRLAGTRPEHVATVIDKKLTAAGKDPLTPGQRATAIETTRKSKDADLALDKATDAWQAKPSAENARRAEAALDKANAEAVELQKFVARFQPRSTSGILKSVLQGNLLTPISEVANLFGNMSFLPFRALDRGIATGLDMIDATIRGKPRELSVQPLAGTAEALKGVGRGVAQIPDILIEGTGNVIKGETRAGLHPIKAWINQFAKNPEMPTTGGKLTLQDRLNLAIEGTFGVPAEVMLRGLGAGDVPFKEAARARTTAEQLGLNKVPREQWPFAQKFPELFLPKAALEQIGRDTAAAVFQRESKTLNVITNWLRGKGEIVDFLAATVAPYKLTPWNIIGEILSYNPLVAMTRGVMDAKKGNTRSAKLNAGKLVVGSMLTGAGVWLYNKGLLAPSLDERDESQKGRVLAGEILPPNHINISGLTRALDGGDPAFKAGDETVDIFRGGGLAGSIFYMTANIGRDFERGPEVSDSDMWMSILRQSTLEQARFGMNQSFLSGVEGLLTAIKDGNADTYVRQWANTVGSIVLPNTLNTISRSSREYKPDFKADKFKDQIKNQLRGKLGDTEGLPLKRDFWGDPMRETPEGRDAIFYHFFDISKNKQVTSDPVELELYRLWRKTADSTVIPSLPSRNLTLARTTYALNPDQYERYAELVGKNRRTITDALVINPNFHKLTDERKIDVLERAYREGLARGRALFYQEQQGSLTPKTGRAGFDK